jgi:exonuclease VII small subunit
MSSCECYRIGEPFIAEDPDCPAHGVDGYEAKLDRAEARIAELEEAIRDELIRRTLTSQPLKFEFMRQRGMRYLDEVHEWMFAVSKRLEDLVDS